MTSFNDNLSNVKSVFAVMGTGNMFIGTMVHHAINLIIVLVL